ncbi:hypothetical protein LIER_29018 [Lithospermum erythrorhizon]|uniref:Uncharacterized protein n=1 Tax=Lithospermum erythrorhizon TaxID=34254 RepID=A0AAV3RIQ7_LITER
MEARPCGGPPGCIQWSNGTFWPQPDPALHGPADGPARVYQRPVEDQELRRVEAERDAANRDALTSRREKEGLRHAYLQDSHRRCRYIGVVVLSNFVMNSQDRSPMLPALADEYTQRFPTGWMDNRVPLPPID